MSPAKSSIISREDTRNPLVRLDAADERYVGVLREIFEANGCDVVINRPGGVQPDYHIVFGDAEFVKFIFTKKHISAKQRMAILISFYDDPPDPLITRDTKIIFFDDRIIGADDASRALQFFFTGQGRVLDLRKNPKKKSAQPIGRRTQKSSDVVKVLERDTEMIREPDRDRVSRIMAELFHESGRGGRENQKPLRRHPDKNQKRKGNGAHRFRGAGIFFAILLAPFFWFYFTLIFSGLLAVSSAQFLKNGNISLSRTMSAWADWWVDRAGATLSPLRVPLSLVGAEGVLRRGEEMVSLLGNVTAAQGGAAGLVVSSTALAGELLARAGDSAPPPAPASQVEKLRTELLSVQNYLSLAQAQIEHGIASGDFPFWLRVGRRAGDTAVQYLNRYRRSILTMDNFLALYPRIAGFRREQTYLVLFQNSMELRPTGGFIGSVGIVTFADGVMKNFEISDVYTLDGQLKGHADPPGPIRELLGQEHWYLRDSNWDPDFRFAGARAAWFYEKETGKTVDGVIAVSSPFVVDLLAGVGPVELTDYQDRITAANFFGKALFYTQENFFPGSTQKRDFLGALASSLLDRIIRADFANPAALLRSVTHAIERRDIQFYFVDWELATLVGQFGWDGSLFTKHPACPQKTCTVDPFAFVEANLGVNKANYFVTRNQTHEITFREDGSYTQSLTVTWRNDSKGPPVDAGGTYRTYVRLLTPPGLRVASVTLEGLDVPQKNPGSGPELPYVEVAEGSTGVDSLGIGLDVPAGSLRSLVVTYETGSALFWEEGKAIYERTFFRASGTKPESVQVLVRYPIFWLAETLVQPAGEESWQSTQTVLAKSGQLEYNTTLTQDRSLRIQFAK